MVGDGDGRRWRSTTTETPERWSGRPLRTSGGGAAGPPAGRWESRGNGVTDRRRSRAVARRGNRATGRGGQGGGGDTDGNAGRRGRGHPGSGYAGVVGWWWRPGVAPGGGRGDRSTGRRWCERRAAGHSSNTDTAPLSSESHCKWLGTVLRESCAQRHPVQGIRRQVSATVRLEIPKKLGLASYA